MSVWYLNKHLPAPAKDSFKHLDAIFALTGKEVSRDPVSNVICVEIDGQRYYVKRYFAEKSSLRSLTGQSRMETELKNAKNFARWGIPTAELLAYGVEKTGLKFKRGAFITACLSAESLAHIAQFSPQLFMQPDWLCAIRAQIATITRIMHQHGFAHNDLHWRNLLVDQDQKVYLIDCPSGRHWPRQFLQYRVTKDLASLYPEASRLMSRSQRLRFYLDYRQQSRLQKYDKAIITKIMSHRSAHNFSSAIATAACSPPHTN
jgi:hypothetical protein